MDHLTVEDLLSIAEEVLGAPAVTDIGLLDSAAHRPQASAFGHDAYPTIHEKAAALLDAVLAGTLPRGTLNANHLRRILEGNDREGVQERKGLLKLWAENLPKR